MPSSLTRQRNNGNTKDEESIIRSQTDSATKTSQTKLRGENVRKLCASRECINLIPRCHVGPYRSFFIKHTLENLNGRIIMDVFIRAKHVHRNT